MVLSFVTFSCDAPAKQEAEMERHQAFKSWWRAD